MLYIVRCWLAKFPATDLRQRLQFIAGVYEQLNFEFSVLALPAVKALNVNLKNLMIKELP